MNSWESKKDVDGKDLNICPYLTYTEEPKYTWEVKDNIFTSTVYAQTENQSSSSVDFSFPFYFTILAFLLFTLIMSGIYMYHWINYTFKDPFVRNFSILYFTVICLFMLPILLNLIS
jgi:CDP-diglyceride synthetase